MHLASICRALAAIFFIAFFSTAATAQRGLQPVPSLDRAVIDRTGTLNAKDRAALEAQLHTLEQARGTQVVVLMVPTTAPEDIAAFSNRVGNAWKVGRREVGDGILVVVAKDDRKMRIEVAKALEGAVPDIAAARIIDGAMKPRFQQGDYAGGLRAAIAQLDARIAGEALPAPPQTGGGHAAATSGGGFDWTDLAVFLFFGVMVAGPVARSLLGGPLGGLVTGAGTGILAFVLTSSAWVAGGAGTLALLYTWLFGSAGRGLAAGHGPMGGRSHDGGGWSSGGGSGGGGFSSGGGGDFGGGGASGDW